MLTEERYSIILERVKQNKSVKLLELCELLKASESTIRRDLTVLDERGLLKKFMVVLYLSRNILSIRRNRTLSQSQSFLPMKSLQLRGFQPLLWMTAISFLSTPERLQAI